MIMINNSVLDESLGVVNGLGQSLASLARMIGPGLGGILWSVSMEVSELIRPMHALSTGIYAFYAHTVDTTCDLNELNLRNSDHET